MVNLSFDNKNYFQIFGFDQVFSIDLYQLEKKYFEFQNLFHPDKSSIEDIEKSIAINEGYKILADDFLRACYLLFLRGVNIDDDRFKPEISVLEEIMEMQEQVANTEAKDDLQKLRKNLNEQVKDLILRAIDLLSDDEINACAQLLVKAKYLKKISHDIKNHKK